MKFEELDYFEINAIAHIFVVHPDFEELIKDMKESGLH